MKIGMRRFGLVSGVLAFIMCVAGGVCLLIDSAFDPDDIFGTGIGLYFIGKGFFVGPMLILASRQFEKDETK